MPSDDQTEQQIDSILIPLIGPAVQSALAKVAVAASTVLGVSITYPSGEAETAAKVIGCIVSAAFAIWHAVYAWNKNKANAKLAYQQGAASAGLTLLSHELPDVVSGMPPAVAVIPSEGPLAGATASDRIVPKVDPTGNVTIAPARPGFLKGTPIDPFPPGRKPADTTNP